MDVPETAFFCVVACGVEQVFRWNSTKSGGANGKSVCTSRTHLHGPHATSELNCGQKNKRERQPDAGSEATVKLGAPCKTEAGLSKSMHL